MAKSEDEHSGGQTDEETHDGDWFPDCVVRRLDRLRELEDSRKKTVAEYLKERAALESKYNGMYAEIRAERALIVQGIADVEGNSATEEPQGVPQFWVCAMGNNDEVSSTFAENDVDCLTYLQDITCTDDEDGKGFTLKFIFAENPYFTNEVLTKRYEVPNLLTGNDPILNTVAGTEIFWRPNRDITTKVVIKKQRGKGKHAGQVRSVRKTEQVESFFNWFCPPQMPGMSEMNEEAAANLEVQMDLDYEIAAAFRTKVVPQAILWFTGEAQEPADLEEAVDELIAATKE